MGTKMYSRPLDPLGVILPIMYIMHIKNDRGEERVSILQTFDIFTLSSELKVVQLHCHPVVALFMYLFEQEMPFHVCFIFTSDRFSP